MSSKFHPMISFLQNCSWLNSLSPETSEYHHSLKHPPIHLNIFWFRLSSDPIKHFYVKPGIFLFNQTSAVQPNIIVITEHLSTSMENLFVNTKSINSAIQNWTLVIFPALTMYVLINPIDF